MCVNDSNGVCNIDEEEEESDSDDDIVYESFASDDLSECDEEGDESIRNFQRSDRETMDVIEQYVGDNIDLNIGSLYGNTAFHAMGIIRITTPKPENVDELQLRRGLKISGDNKVQVLNNIEVKLIPYCKNVSSLHSIVFRPIDELIKAFTTVKPVLSPADFSWLVGWIIKQSDTSFAHPNWKGFMRGIHPIGTRDKSYIEFLPIINGDPNAITTIYTTLLQRLKVTN